MKARHCVSGVRQTRMHSQNGRTCVYVTLLLECACLLVFSTRTEFEMIAATVAAVSPMLALRRIEPAKVSGSGKLPSRTLYCTESALV